MIQVSKYINYKGTPHENLSEWEKWELCNFDAKMLVITEYIGDRVEDAFMKLGRMLLNGEYIRKSTEEVPSVQENIYDSGVHSQVEQGGAETPKDIL